MDKETFHLVALSQLRRFYQVASRGENFSACQTVNLFFAFFFGPTAFTLACHGFANAVTLRMALGML